MKIKLMEHEVYVIKLEKSLNFRGNNNMVSEIIVTHSANIDVKKTAVTICNADNTVIAYIPQRNIQCIYRDNKNG